MFKNRAEAGKCLAEKVLNSKENFDVVVAIPRGGIAVGFEISNLLNLPLKPLVVKKVPTLGEAELAAGAIGPEGFSFGRKSKKIGKLVEDRIAKYGGLPLFENKNIILVDDGVATGATIETAISYLKKKKVGKILVAVPVVTQREFQKLQQLVDLVIALETPYEFMTIGEFYTDFTQVTDEEVIQLLQR